MEQHCSRHNKKYDIVIKMRFDMEFTHVAIDRDLLDDIKHDIIFMPNADCKHDHFGLTACSTCDTMYSKHKLRHVHMLDHANIVCDTFAYGSMDSMKEYCSLYNAFDDINRTYAADNESRLSKIKTPHTKVGRVFSLNKRNTEHLHSIYLYVCSFPERMLQIHLKNYMLVTSNKIKVRFHR
jgi:hypothetical protein